MTEECDNLPRGWDYECLGQLGVWSGGGTPSKANDAYWTNGTIPWVSPKDMKSERIRSSEDLITEEATQRTPAKPVPPGSVLMVTRSGILAHTFPVAVTERVVAINQDLKSLTPYEGIDANFVAWCLRYRSSAILAECGKHGTTVASIEMDRLRKLRVPVAPAKEQRRIVEKIEALFAELDKGEESLRQVQTLLVRYRQSVLKAAVTGELTADWRARHAGKLEHGRDLLARILKARRENWQGRGKYKEPVEPDTADLPELPDGWVWATVDQVSMEVDYGSSAKCTELKGGVPVLRMGNIVEGTLTFDDLKYLPNDHREFPKLLLRLGDLLFNRTNSAELVGKTAVYKGFPERCSFASYLIRVRLCEVWPDYVSAYINSVFGRRWVASVVSQQVGQANVNGSKLKALAFPLPPLVEQEMIVRRMGEALERADDVSQRVHEELGRSSALRQSILKDAFSGKLVPQEPSDEPAAELLARIRAQRSVECKDAGRARVAI